MRRNQRGFTLLEVLVATLILAGVLVVVMPTISTVLLNRQRVSMQDGALLVARSQLSQWLAETGDLATQDFMDQGYRVKRSAEQLAQVDGVTAWRATVSVVAPNTVPVTLSTIMLRKPPEAP